MQLASDAFHILEDKVETRLASAIRITDLRQKPAELNIEVLDDIAPPPAPTVEGITHRLRALNQSLSRTFKSTQLASEAWMKQPNTVSVDSTEEGLDTLFPTPDNEYVGGWYKLEEDEAPGASADMLISGFGFLGAGLGSRIG